MKTDDGLLFGCVPVLAAARGAEAEVTGGAEAAGPELAVAATAVGVAAEAGDVIVEAGGAEAVDADVDGRGGTLADPAGRAGAEALAGKPNFFSILVSLSAFSSTGEAAGDVAGAATFATCSPS